MIMLHNDTLEGTKLEYIRIVQQIIHVKLSFKKALPLYDITINS